MKKRIIGLFGIVLSTAMILTACGSGSSGKYAASSDSAAYNSKSTQAAESYYDYDGYYEDTADYSNEAYDDFGSTSGKVADTVDDSASVSDKNKVDNSRKLIKTVNMDVETKEFDTLVNVLDQQVSAHDGYIESQNIWNGSRYDYYGNYQGYSSRNASYTIRVPREKLEDFLATFSDLCNVKNKSESVEDITLSYVDLESHKKALQTEEERLLDLMKQATEMYDILTIEDKLTDIRYQIQSMESQLRTYDNKVTYSTIYMSITEVKELTIEEPEPETFWDKLSSKFVHSMESMGDGFQNFTIWFIAALPHLLLWGGICFGIAMLVRAIVKYNIKKAKKRREEAAKNAPAQPQVTVQAPIYYAQAPMGYYPQTAGGVKPAAPQNPAQPVKPAANTAVSKADAVKADDKKDINKDDKKADPKQKVKSADAKSEEAKPSEEKNDNK